MIRVSRLRRRHALLLAVTGIAAAFAAHAHPATGAVQKQARVDAVCAPGSAWSSVSTVFGTSGLARGSADQPREPELGQALAHAPKRKEKTSGVTTVPTWVHVVSPDGVTANVSSRAIREQISVMTLAFGGFYGGANTGFAFELAGVTRTVNAAWYTAGPGTAAEHEMKQTLHRGGDDTLNLYLTTASGYLGWAYYPSITDSTTVSHLDGVVVDWESMPGVSETYAGRYDRGFTAVHEAGHWLNLAHTFEGACSPENDHVADTPAMVHPTSGCPEGKDSCPGHPGLDPIHNFMDYSYDTCYFEFTSGQSARMNDAWAFWRAT